MKKKRKNGGETNLKLNLTKWKDKKLKDKTKLNKQKYNTTYTLLMRLSTPRNKQRNLIRIRTEYTHNIHIIIYRHEYRSLDIAHSFFGCISCKYRTKPDEQRILQYGKLVFYLNYHFDSWQQQRKTKSHI